MRRNRSRINRFLLPFSVVMIWLYTWLIMLNVVGLKHLTTPAKCSSGLVLVIFAVASFYYGLRFDTRSSAAKIWGVVADEARLQRLRARAVQQSLVAAVPADGSLCAICLLSMHEDACALKCAHAYHTECIVRWLSTAPTCPVCRSCVKLQSRFQFWS